MLQVGERNWTSGRSQTLLHITTAPRKPVTDATVTRACRMLLLHLIQSSSLCCLVCVCFVQAVCRVNNEREDVTWDPHRVEMTMIMMMVVAARVWAVRELPQSNLPEPKRQEFVQKTMLANRMSLLQHGDRWGGGATTEKEKQTTENTFPCSQRRNMHFWIAVASARRPEHICSFF